MNVLSEPAIPLILLLAVVTIIIMAWSVYEEAFFDIVFLITEYIRLCLEGWYLNLRLAWLEIRIHYGEFKLALIRKYPWLP